MSRVAAALLTTILLAGAIPVESQAPVARSRLSSSSKQQGQDGCQGTLGHAGVIIRDGKARGRGGVALQDTTRRTARSEGVFTIVQGGGTASLLVASEVPSIVVLWFRGYATGQGHVVQGTAWRRVGTTLVGNPAILPNGQIRVRLTPQVSYFSPEGDGSIEFNGAATEVIVPNGRAMRIGGATRGINPAVTRQILGYCEQRATSESSFILTATVQ